MSALVILGVEDVLALHRRQLARWGGAEGLHDLPAIEAACAAPHQVLRYENGDLVDCAAALMWHLCANHGFRDGNKRVGTVAGIVMLSVNGVALPDDPGFQAELIQLMMRTAQGLTTRQEVAAFLRQRIL
ncbi:MAG: type II toxin-antitoxin system death-on-curing family toxin [Holophagaceae bacterium]|nr:type II toxin-antitoxin system death-on-curing family toxin [Holophagaceae bacterium]